MLLQIIGNRSQVRMGVGRLLLTLKKKPQNLKFLMAPAGLKGGH
jgi:hypothetical protein